MKRVVLGAKPGKDHTTFAVFSTVANKVEVQLKRRDGARTETFPLDARGDGFFVADVGGVGPGALYGFVLDGKLTPDPYARELPFGVHGLARVVAPVSVSRLSEPPAPHAWVLYEMHVGTFTPEGTFAAAETKLADLAALGVTAIELLPVAAFDGKRGWGYDGVALFAPFAPYGGPDDLASFVRAAHRHGLAVVLDVVYNHFGPAGNYLARYSPEYFRDEENVWGVSPNFGGAAMRALVLENVRYWLEVMGFDGLRLDATHAIVDDSRMHVLRAVTDLAHAMNPPARIFFEDERNDPSVLTELGADAVWADDFHHQVHTLLTGERDGYYAAYEPTVPTLARAIEDRWTFTGQPYGPWKGKPRGAPAKGIAFERFVYATQNHDQVGNRALGTRLDVHAGTRNAALAAMLLLFLPQTPLLFMGQEWAASTPFLFFSDHEGDLGRGVSEGRRREFAHFAAFADADAREKIPDPQDEATFAASHLDWSERAREPHASVLALYEAMLRLRRTDPVLSVPADAPHALEVIVVGDVLTVVRREGALSRRLVLNFGASAHLVAGDTSAELLTWGDCESGALAPGSGVLLVG